MEATISLFEAITQMRLLTKKGQSFSFAHSTLNTETKKSECIRVVRKAKLRAAARQDDLKNADYKLFYYDMQINEPRVCWQCLLMYFNNKRIILN